MNDLDMLTEDVDLDSIVDIDIDANGEVMPEKNGKIALIDADTIAYTACLSSEYSVDVLPEDFYSEEEWFDIVNNPNYVEEEGTLYDIDLNEALEKAGDKIQRILDKTGCVKAELHFSGGKDNFRYDIFPAYKANRTTRTPAGLQEVKELLIEKYDSTLNTKWEADDIVVYLKTKYPDKYILCAIDKDVLNSVPGRNFNYYESAIYNKDMRWVDVDRHTSLVWKYIQTLTGDKIDGIIGLKGIGPKKAEKIIANKMTHRELWEAVLKAYKEKNRSEEDALTNINLVDMHLLTEDSNGELYIKLNTHEDLLNG